LDNGYKANTKVFGGGLEIHIKPTWTIGAQYNNVSVDLDGSDSTSKLRKTHYGLFNMLRGNTLSLATNVGFAQNKYGVKRTVEGIFNNESSTQGGEWWLNNRVYWHATKWLSPFAGYTYGKYRRNGFVESGSIQSARTVGSINEISHTGEFGLSASTRFGGKKGELFGVNVSGTYATDNSIEVAGGVDVGEVIFIDGVHQISDGMRNNLVSAKVKFKF
jgi:uncharacterized protein with beta-barrel porin domain